VSDDTRSGEKKQRLLTALDQGLTQIHLDARRAGVLVPERYRSDHHLVLNLSYKFDPPDLAVSDWGVRQTLSFGGQRFTVAAPWSAVYAVASLVSREFWMFPDDMPDELADAATERVTKGDLRPADAPTAPPAPAPSPRAVLREVVVEPREGEEPKEPSPPRRGHLRVVK
jgi:stringent starvation protein B